MVMTGGWAVGVPEGYLVSCWRVGTPIASGSWSSVYEAWPMDGGGPSVAVKFIPTGTVTQRQLGHLADMARREQEAYCKLQHPRIIQLLDAVVIDDPGNPRLDGAVALVTERAERTLSAVIAGAAGEAVPGASRLLREICEGLAHIHEAGWVHGDVKPSNILVMADGSVRLADFGLAAELDGTHGYVPPRGTTDYLPPERWGEQVTTRGVAIRESADIWALGVIACQLATGRMPFPGPTTASRAAAVARYAMTGAPVPRVDGLPECWRSVIVDCLEPDPGARRRLTARSLLDRLQELPVVAEQEHQATSAGPGMAVTARHSRHRWTRVGTGAAAALCAMAGGAVLLWGTTGPASPRSTAGYAQYLNTRADIPARYLPFIAQAGHMCEGAGMSPALVAGILKAESGFNPHFADPKTQSYGIAGWTPKVLGGFMDPAVGTHATIADADNPAIAIPAVGRFLCSKSRQLQGVPGDPAVSLAEAYQSSAEDVVAGTLSPAVRKFGTEVRRWVSVYQPG